LIYEDEGIYTWAFKFLDFEHWIFNISTVNKFLEKLKKKKVKRQKLCNTSTKLIWICGILNTILYNHYRKKKGNIFFSVQKQKIVKKIINTKIFHGSVANKQSTPYLLHLSTYDLCLHYSGPQALVLEKL